MPSPLLQTLHKVLFLEAARGFRDDAVLGGLATFATRWSQQANESKAVQPLLKRTVEAFRDYAHLTSAARRRLVERVESLLDQTLPRAGPPGAFPSPTPEAPLQILPGVGPRREAILTLAGLTTLADLLYYFPRRYDDRRQLRPISLLEDGSRACVSVAVRSAGQVRRRPGLSIVEVPAADATGVVHLTWFNQQYMAAKFRPGQHLLASGRVRKQRKHTALIVENCEVALPAQQPLQVGRIVPIYPLVSGLERIGQTFLRRWVREALAICAETMTERLPQNILERRSLTSLPQALRDIHFPEDYDALERARRRLAFEELFLLQLAFLQRARQSREAPAPSLQDASEAALQMSQRLPFPLTRAQQRVLAEICRDMASAQPMNRLLQGDVGSGKTLVAGLAAYAAVKNGYQVAFMAPTEVLATQHFRVLSDLLGADGLEVALLIGSLQEGDKQMIRRRLEQGEAILVVGTHALLQEAVAFARLGLAVIDEQHRFGVAQRGLLRQKGTHPEGRSCHLLVMTATPIPRTLTLAFYGDLDASVIDQMPPGRSPVQTSLVSREQAHRRLAQHLAAGAQAYVVCPAIEGSPTSLSPQCEVQSPPAFHSRAERTPHSALCTLNSQLPTEVEGTGELTAVIPLAEELKAGLLAPYQVEILHGQMSRDEKDAVLSRFRQGTVQALIATTVIEVGMDVPSATLMVIEDAERFGLAQLHQLRGRVGRGEAASTCLLVADPASESLPRLQILLETNDGFRIAEEDLRLRGPGEFYGLRQHGLPELKVANLATDLDVLLEAREEAQQTLALDPALSFPGHLPLRTGPSVPSTLDYA